jgi:dTDP-4-dehydrorhamnose 3,5-epimerase
MDKDLIDGVKLIPLKQIFHPKGDVYHGIKKSDDGFVGFGEAYFSTIIKDEIKPWKKHTKMTLNIVVPVGEIQFVIFDDRTESKTRGKFFSKKLSNSNYYRLVVPPNVWVSFKGIGNKLNLLLNIADLEHDPNEIVRKDLNKIKFTWT